MNKNKISLKSLLLVLLAFHIFGSFIEGSTMNVKKSVTFSAQRSAIRYYKFIRTAALPNGVNYLRKLSGQVSLRQRGDYTLSLNSIMIAPNCPHENSSPFLFYDNRFNQALGPIQHNLAQFILRGSTSSVLDYKFSSPIPVSGCLVLIFDGGPLSGTSTFTMSADLKLEFDESAAGQSPKDPILLTSGWEFFPGRPERALAYLQPIWFKGQLKQIYGNYSNKGTNRSITEYYVARNGCGTFPPQKQGYRLIYRGPRNTLLNYLPANSKLIHKIDKTTSNGRIGLIQETVSHDFEPSVELEAGDCLVSITYAPQSARMSGANFENQLKYFLLPQ
ncbi:hypothetical protein EBT16_03500 [bacterium]|nr:hypothetical protein [bacterium]